MLTRIMPARLSLLRVSIAPTYAHNTRRLLNTGSTLSRSSSPTSSASPIDFDSSSSDLSSTLTQPKRWSRHVIGKKDTQQLDSPVQTPTQSATQTSAPAPAPAPAKKRKRRTLKPLKAPITLTETAKSHLRALSNGPNPKLIRISVRNRGCSGLTYHLEYVDSPEKFDEIVQQDDIKIVIDSKALFSIIGSEMDWIDNKLSSKFVFKNPNSKGTCGCGESFMV